MKLDVEMLPTAAVHMSEIVEPAETSWERAGNIAEG